MAPLTLITIITPTIGSRHFRKLLQSLNDLNGLGNLFEIEHYIAIDHSGIHGIRVNTQLNEVAPGKGITRYVWNIPIHSGAGNYKGHRIYAGISQFVNGEYTLFLDDDNYLHPSHILNFMKGDSTGTGTGIGTGREKYDWQFSLREIVDSAEGKHICFDQCESIGHLAPVYYDNSGQSYLIDTNCYFIKSEVLKEISPIWNRPAKYNGGDPDRLLGQLLMTRFPKYRCTREHTLAYRVGNGGGGGGECGVSPELFLKGNQIVATRFGGKNSDRIWQKPALYLIHFNAAQTQRILQRIYSGKRDAECAFQQWQLNLFDCKEIQDRYVILDAYKARYIPSGSVVWIHMCNPGELPASILERNDLKKILYTIESPNIRHQAQWNDAGFLSKYFTQVITYWDGVLGLGKEGPFYQYYPFIHRCDMSNPAYMPRKEDGNREKSVMILLENRPFQESYQINGITLHAQDALRKEAVQQIAKYFPVVCYGDSWKLLDGDKTTCDQSAHRAIQGLKARGSENEPRLRSDLHIQVKETGSRFLDQDKTIDYYQKHYFAIIVENCDAVGYVSEKIYDAWMASCIPIYYGNIDDRLRRFFGEEIPIDKMMIDMRKIGVKNIGDYMSELYVDEIEEMQALIRQYKERILDRVGIRSYAQLVVETVENVGDL